MEGLLTSKIKDRIVTSRFPNRESQNKIVITFFAWNIFGTMGNKAKSQEWMGWRCEEVDGWVRQRKIWASKTKMDEAKDACNGEDNSQAYGCWF